MYKMARSVAGYSLRIYYIVIYYLDLSSYSYTKLPKKLHKKYIQRDIIIYLWMY